MTSPVTTRRPATPADADFLFRLVEMTERHIAERVRGWDDEAERRRVHDLLARASVSIVEHNGADIAAIAVEREPGRHILALLRVLPLWQGRGIGTLLLDEARARAQAEDATCEVVLYRADSSIPFYRAEGFEPVCETLLTVTLGSPTPA